MVLKKHKIIVSRTHHTQKAKIPGYLGTRHPGVQVQATDTGVFFLGVADAALDHVLGRGPALQRVLERRDADLRQQQLELVQGDGAALGSVGGWNTGGAWA